MRDKPVRIKVLKDCSRLLKLLSSGAVQATGLLDWICNLKLECDFYTVWTQEKLPKLLVKLAKVEKLSFKYIAIHKLQPDIMESLLTSFPVDLPPIHG